MFAKRELLDAISECENAPESYQNCSRLATFYTLYDHLYPNESSKIEQVTESTVESYGDSEFYKAVEGVNAKDAWAIMSELMETMKVMQPKVYNSIMYKLQQEK